MYARGMTVREIERSSRTIGTEVSNSRSFRGLYGVPLGIRVPPNSSRQG